MAISRAELLRGKDFASLTTEQKTNFEVLIVRLNLFRSIVGIPMTVTNCIRTWAEHLAIYAKKGITDLAKIPKKSRHLIAAAADFADPAGALAALVTEDLLERCGLWCEDPKHTKGWLHLQCVPYPSWKPGMSRIFKP